MRKRVCTGNQVRSQSMGFTLIELLVVIAIIAILAAMLLPALAMAKRKALLIADINNEHQLGIGTMEHASDNHGMYPITTVGGVNNYSQGKFNYINGIHYTRYIFQNDSGQNGELMPNYLVKSTSPQKGYQDQNLGYLYVSREIPNAKAFFDPALRNVTARSPLYTVSENYYIDPTKHPSFPVTNGGTSGDTGAGCVRSSYMFNPRLYNVHDTSLNIWNRRAYQKTSDVRRKDVFIVDYLEAQASGTGIPFNSAYWPHWPEKGLNVLWTDGSASTALFQDQKFFNGIVQHLVSAEGASWPLQYDAIFNNLGGHYIYPQ